MSGFSKMLVVVSMVVMTLIPAQSWAARKSVPEPFVALQSQGVKFFARFALVDDSGWKVLVKQQEGEDLLTVQDDRTSKVLFSAPGNSERFLSAEAVQVQTRSEPYLVTRWTKGAHGQEIRIYDPRRSDQALVYSKTSSWTIEYEHFQGRIKITGRGEDPLTAKNGASFEVAWP